MSERPRSATVLAVSALALGLAASVHRFAAAQETDANPPLRGLAAPADDPQATAAVADRDEQIPPPRRRARLRPRPRPVTAKPVRAPVTGPIRGDVAKTVAQPVVLLPVPDTDAPPPRRRRRPWFEDDAYAPLGWRVGGMTYSPAIEGSVGHDSNPNRASGPVRASPLLKTEGELKFESDWLVHALKGSLRGAYFDYPDARDANRPEADGLVTLRIDASHETQIDLETRFRVDTERPGSVNLPVTGVARPINTAAGASAEVTQRFNRLSLAVRGSVDHFTYEDVRLSDGTIFDQSDRDYTEYAMRVRTAYEAKPGVIPFIETEIDTRRHDRRIDDAGFARDSNGVTARAGTTFELSRLVIGEVAAGYSARRYEDPRLEDVHGPVFDASVIWAATPLTTVRLKAETDIGETTAIGSNGVFSRTAGIEIEHALRRNVTLIGSATFYDNDYRGLDIEEKGFVGSVKIDYKLTRSLVMRASFTHERLDSSVEGSDYTANVYLVGLRLQR